MKPICPEIDLPLGVSIEHHRTVSASHGPGCIAVTGYASAEYAADPDLWFRMIHEIDRSILSSLEPVEILETTIRNLSRIVPCDMAMILLVDEKQQGFTRAAFPWPMLTTP